jgi:hypothetical protein
MSALRPKADIVGRNGDVRFVPKADILRCGKERRYSITSSARASAVEGDHPIAQPVRLSLLLVSSAGDAASSEVVGSQLLDETPLANGHCDAQRYWFRNYDHGSLPQILFVVSKSQCRAPKRPVR